MRTEWEIGNLLLEGHRPNQLICIKSRMRGPHSTGRRRYGIRLIKTFGEVPEKLKAAVSFEQSDDTKLEAGLGCGV